VPRPGSRLVEVVRAESVRLTTGRLEHQPRLHFTLQVPHKTQRPESYVDLVIAGHTCTQTVWTAGWPGFAMAQVKTVLLRIEQQFPRNSSPASSPLVSNTTKYYAFVVEGLALVLTPQSPQ
jgi:hypothetical protein